MPEEIQPIETNILKHTLKEISQPFIDLFKASRALWGINLSYLLEGLTYFGVVGLLAIYFNNYIKLNDINAGLMVSIQTGGITIAMLLLGATVDFIGVRKALLISLILMLVGRVFLASASSLSATTGLWSAAHLIAMAGILGVILGYGIYQPACYTAVKKFTNEKTSAMGYAMLYALMNLGGFLPGLISPPVRRSFGITGVFWLYSGLTLVGIFIVLIILSNKAINREIEINKPLEDKKEDEIKKIDERTLGKKVTDYLKRFPYKDFRFMFFIFILIPVQTLFAHNWLTLPQYCERAYTGIVHENFEFFVNFNPILIFILTPTIAVLTLKRNTYKMMIAGTAVMGLSPFLLFFGPNIYVLFAYIIIMTIGEAMWQPRFLQWVAEIAPKDMTGIYMGIGQFPWFMTKVFTGFYSGWFLTKFCPQGVPAAQTNTQTMWLIYGFIAILSPIALFLARNWMLKGFKTKSE
jgi:proton-dependent oligopeptide transporter, POT family